MSSCCEPATGSAAAPAPTAPVPVLTGALPIVAGGSRAGLRGAVSGSRPEASCLGLGVFGWSLFLANLADKAYVYNKK